MQCRNTALSACLFAGIAAGSAETTLGQQYAKRAPYDAIRWSDDTPEVRVAGEWSELLSIDGAAVADIVEFCRKRYAGRWRKRFDEDLVQVLSEMGRPPGRSVKLQLRDVDSGALRMVEAAMTAANRASVMDSKYQPPPATLTIAQARADLRELRRLLEERFSYFRLKGIDVDQAFAAVDARLSEGMPTPEFGVELRKLVARFGDGHSRVRPLSSLMPRGYLPFAVVDIGGRFAAIDPRRRECMDPRRPFIAAIDGVGIDRWIEAAAKLDAEGSPQLVRRRAAMNLAYAAYLRRELGIEPAEALTVELAASDGGDQTAVRLPLAPRPTGYSLPLPDDHRLLEGNVGYLRVSSMDGDEAFQQKLRRAMQNLRDTGGLIIDVRGNGGGSREPLRTLLPYFVKPGEPPAVVNVAAYRLGKGDEPDKPEGYLKDRYLLPAGASKWSDSERRAISAFAPGFKPEWTPPRLEFSDWHYMVISPAAARAGDGGFHYERPVIVLMNEDCYSATDIFLAAFKGRPNVTLMGGPSGGGSGRSIPYLLPNSGLEVRLSSMASFRPDGRLYDGRGIEPDVLMQPVLEDYLGSGDSVLEAAVARLR